MATTEMTRKTLIRDSSQRLLRLVKNGTYKMHLLHETSEADGSHGVVVLLEPSFACAISSRH